MAEGAQTPEAMKEGLKMKVSNIKCVTCGKDVSDEVQQTADKIYHENYTQVIQM